MSGTCVIGLQWGDEAKGKLVDLLTSQFEVVVRYQGGANAGHTVVIGDQTYKLHHVPSGILNAGVMNVVTPGVVLHPETLLKELDNLAARGVDFAGRLLLSDRAHVVCPWHLAEDRAINESTTDKESIGTTMRGIGPCYRDKVGRTHAVRLGDLYRPDFGDRLMRIIGVKQGLLSHLNPSLEPLAPSQILTDFREYARRLEPYVADTTAWLLRAVEEGKRLLFEGAQGALLDVDHGTYPFVTSSNSSGVGVSAGSGVPGRWISKVIGVAKCYTTRVGGGPFPTELTNEIGEHIRRVGKEYGTTTGRPRRCGWFDAVAVRYTSRLSGIDCLSMMMLDVLSDLPEIKICTAYELHGKRLTEFPSHADDLRQVQGVYATLPGWRQDITRIRQWNDLPAAARAYVSRISELIQRPIEFISVGPDRQQTILCGKAPAFGEDRAVDIGG